MVAADFLQDPRVQGWLDGVEPAWTLLTFESLLALRHEPSAVQSAIQIANDLSVDEIAGRRTRKSLTPVLFCTSPSHGVLNYRAQLDAAVSPRPLGRPHAIERLDRRNV